ncbi:MAG: acetate--CoA ligase family protein [Anaerolineae bacterium]|nr:acetate--CoA ligase family protein [Anaerolineae bacterium]
MSINNSLKITRLFEPRTVAVIGASSNPNKIGYTIVKNIVQGGYSGHVYPVNPKGGKILELPIYQTIDEIEGEIDVATIAIPAPFVFDVVKACAAKGVKYLSIITSGFSEVGNTEEEKQIVTYAREHGMGVLGPNIFGIYSAAVSLDATFGPGKIMAGNVAIITQSGALGIAMIGKTATEKIGLSAIVSVGNKADVDEADLLDYLTYHDGTKVILMYIEGIKQGEKFIKALKEATQKKPVVVIKSGRSKRGAVAAASHTGSLAGTDEIFDAIMRQCGVLRAESLDDAFSWAKFLADTPMPDGENTVIVTNGGGIGVMATDACEKYNVKLYDDLHTLKQIFSPVTPDFGSTKNPVDITGQAAPNDYNSALGAGLKNNEISSMIALYCETAVFDADSLSRMIKTNYANYQAGQKPIVFSILGGEAVENSITTLRKEGVPIFADVYEAVSCLGAAYKWRSYLQDYTEEVDTTAMDINAIEQIAQNALQDGRTFLLADEAQQLMAVAGLPMPQSHVAHSLDEAVRLAEKIGYPVVMKVVSRDILHKSDAGGVALDLDNKEEIIDAYQAIIQNCRAYNPQAVIQGIEVSEMVKSGTEVILGARKDGAFGPIVMFGLGGIYVEVMKDVAFRAAPLNRSEIVSMIKEIKSYPLLLGVRGEARKDIESIIDTLVKLATLIRQSKSITDIEINPLMVYEQGDGTKAVDVRVLVSNVEKGNPNG